MASEVIEIFDSSDEREIQSSSGQLLATPVPRVSRSPKRASFKMSTGKPGVASPSFANISHQDHGQITSESHQVSTIASSSLIQSLPATPATQSIRSKPSSLATEKVLGDLPDSTDHSRNKTSVSEEASKMGSASDDANTNMRDLNVTMGLASLRLKKGKGKEVSVMRTPASFSSRPVLKVISDHNYI